MSENVLNPEVTDVAETQITGVKTRYSKKELEEFRSVIEKQLLSKRQDLAVIQGSVKNEHDIADTSPTFKVLEEGKNTLSISENSRDVIRLTRHINNLERALVRIENGTYGVCRETGKLIPRERLLAVPHATLCVDATEKVNGNGKFKSVPHQLQSRRF